MQLQSLTWSDYKKQHCQVVGIAPNGMISFLSDGCGEEEQIDPGDVILADRSFTINSELLMRCAKLEIPPPSSGWEQQTTEALSKQRKWPMPESMLSRQVDE